MVFINDILSSIIGASSGLFIIAILRVSHYLILTVHIPSLFCTLELRVLHLPFCSRFLLTEYVVTRNLVAVLEDYLKM